MMLKDEFNRSSTIIFILTTMASGINYLCQILMGRALDLENFGIINSIFSFTLICGVPGTAFNLIMAKYSAENIHKSNKISSYITKIIKIAVYMFVCFIPLFYFGKNFVGQILGTKDIEIIVITMLIVVISIIPPIFIGALSGVKRFILVGILSIILPTFKLLGILLGMSFKLPNIVILNAILISMLLGNICTVIIANIFLNRISIKVSLKNMFMIESKNILVSQDIEIFIVNLLVTVFTNVDIILISIFFGGESVGIYSSVILFGRIVYYFVTALVTVMLPLVVRANAEDTDPLRLFKRTLTYTLTLSTICLVPLNLFSNYFIKIIFGGKFYAASEYMLYASIISVLLSFLMIVMNYLIAMSKVKFLIKSLIIALLVLMLLVTNFNATVSELLLSICVVLLTNLIFNLAYCFKKTIRS